jgi:hypothetical protein
MISSGGSRRLGYVCLVLFVGSGIFPIAAGVLAVDVVPRWIGIADVATAGALFAAAIAVITRSGKSVTDEDKVTALKALQRLSLAVPALLVLFLVWGGGIRWDVMIVGLAWRVWLLVQILPALVAALGW